MLPFIGSAERFSGNESALTFVSDVFSIFNDLLSSQENRFRSAFLFESFKRTVVNAFKVGLDADDAFIVRIEDNDVCIEAYSELAFLFKTVDFCRCSCIEVYEPAL